MSLVIDAATLVASLVDRGPDGKWAAAVLADHELPAPHLMPIEAANILRHAPLADDITTDASSLAHGDLPIGSGVGTSGRLRRSGPQRCTVFENS